MAIRLAVLPLSEVINLTGNDNYPRWAGGVTVNCDLISERLANDELIAPNDDRDPNAEISAGEHASRVAWLVQNIAENACSLTIKDGQIKDGNHRFAAALFRGDQKIRVCFMS